MLNFQLDKHEDYLKKFTKLFRSIDKRTQGYLNTLELELLIKEMGLAIYARRLLQCIDPNKTGKVSFSECVKFFTAESIDPNKDNESILDFFNGDI